MSRQGASPIQPGQTFGRLTTMSIHGRRRSGIEWRCRCDCGNEGIYLSGNLRNGSASSCGCRKRELNASLGVRDLFLYDPFTGRFTWRVDRPGFAAGDEVCAKPKKSSGYVYVSVCGRQKLAHRVAWECFYGSPAPGIIDHINGDRSDNRIANLRSATSSENAQNQRSARSDNKTSGLLGVCKPVRLKKFVAQIAAGGRKFHLGSFSRAEDAHSAYIAAKRDLHPAGTL